MTNSGPDQCKTLDPSLQICTHNLEQLIRSLRLFRTWFPFRVEDVETYVVRQQLRHQSIHRTTCGSDESQHIRTILLGYQSSFYCLDLAPNSAYPQNQLFLFLNRMCHRIPAYYTGVYYQFVNIKFM